MNPRLTIPVGINNKFIDKIAFTFAMNSFKIGYLQMTDASNERYSIPVDSVNKPHLEPSGRLDMLGF
jgi:hypothetical protein